MTAVGVVGATGYTGTLVVRELLGRGERVVAVGRSPEKLDALPESAERRVADALDSEAVRKAIDGCRVIVSCVGPFVDLGEPTLRAAVAAGVHYLDTTGEQAFMRTVFERYDQPARDAGVAVVPAVGFDYVPGDMAASIAARELDGTPESIDVYYTIRKAKASDGTKRTGMRVAELPCLRYRDGELVEARIGDDERRFGFPSGEASVALWPGGEPITVPRHTGAREVAVYMRMPKAAAKLVQRSQMASPVLKAGRSALGAQTRGPDGEARRRGTYEVVAVARGPSGEVRCTVTGHDMYGMTAAACAEAASRTVDSVGALAPAEAFEPGAFLSSLGDYLTWRVEH